MSKSVATSIKPYFIVFMASACGLVLEIVAGRLLAPTIGVSLYTWTAIIGTVLAGISVGSFAGGVLADRFPTPTTLGVILLAGGASSLSVLPLVAVFSEASLSLPILARIVFMAGSLFFVPSLILGMVTPLVIKLELRDLADTGKVVGRVYALSASGSIFGTFITGFVLIQWVGARHTLILVAVTLMVLALVFGDLRRGKILSFVLLVVLLALGTAAITSGVLGSGCTRESNYYCINVSDVESNEGRTVKALHLDKLLHSYVSVEEPEYLEYGYEKVLADIAAVVAKQNTRFRTLIIGGGGYTLPRYLEQVYPDSSVEVIEVDREVTQVASDYLGLSPETSIVTYNQDARVMVPRLPEGQYDLVIGDAFHDISVPYHLTTLEFNEQVQALLNVNGIYAVNVIDKLQSGRFLRAFVNTLQQTFDYVYVISEDTQWRNDRQHTYVVVGSPRPLLPTDLRNAGVQTAAGPSVSNIMPQGTFDSWIAAQDRVLLTDDYAPVDSLMSAVYFAETSLSEGGKRYNAGLEFQAEGRSTEAIAEFSESIIEFHKTAWLDPEVFRAYRDRGIAYVAIGRFISAIHDFEDAIDLEPWNPAPYVHRGIAYGKLGQTQLAVQDFTEAISLDPKNSSAYNNRGTGYANLGQTKLAVQDYDEAIRLDPGNPGAYKNRGRAHRALGQYALAVEDFGRSIALDATDAEVFADRALAFTYLNLDLEAQRDVDKAVQAGFPVDYLENEIGKIQARR